MRSGFIITLIAVFLFAGGYFYYVAQAICPIPLAYTIGEIDASFDLSFEEAKLVIAEAESIWEDATGQNLFTYDKDADFTINFIYDERQATTDAEGNFKDKLDTTQHAADAINETYDELVNEYDHLQSKYTQAVDRYERDIEAYNSQVEELNARGGATSKEFEVLEERKIELDGERQELNTLSSQLNDLVTEINKVGDRGNKLIETYNRGVNEYNDTFGHSREFTQGTYSTEGHIDIYAYTDKDELRLVLAHELGHAISLDHVPNERSIMYFLIGDQPKELEPSVEDLAEYVRVCSETSFWDTITGSLDN